MYQWRQEMDPFLNLHLLISSNQMKLKTSENPQLHASSHAAIWTRPIGNALHSSSHATNVNNLRWIFEKYDGVRGFWNPLKKAFFSRKGNKFPFPQDVIDSMPADLFLDGELWYVDQILAILT